MQRRLPVVEAAFGHERDQIVGIEIDGVGVGCRNIIAAPPPHQPRTRAEKVLAGDGGKGVGQARIVDPCGGEDLLGVGGADDAEFGLRVHCFHPGSCYDHLCDLTHRSVLNSIIPLGRPD
jgi:hypothetical protein